MPFKKGDPRPAGAGRRPGSPNKTTQELKEALMGSLVAAGRVKLDDPEADPMQARIAYFRDLALKNPQVYGPLLAKILPAELKADFEGGLPLVVWRDYSGRMGDGNGDTQEEGSEEPGQATNGEARD